MVGEQSMRRSVAAIADAVPLLRSELTDFAARLGADAEQLQAIRLAISEAVTNAVVHAYRGGPGTVTVTAALAADELWVLVADTGCGHQAPATDPGLGWGLALIAEATDSFVVAERAGGGTELRMCFRLVRDATQSPRSRRSSRSTSSAAAPTFSTTT
jgi:anti-sigma regulatory factor (Ser/Thr protein kinase)